ncbi:MAG: membrane protein insertion efficiency factor YidD [Schaalia hyovaginalis]|uniref:membrane protein insertion efficiency factor YidD n=1 Tax=Schaalia hyovaginalis TaxID=29316 RepID=UPI0023F6B12A|nr:membrane protein insertion efficiency factor YidD [Schaalia hyovaginalis]MCI7671532.1 membrane protein insertion efficiency factor YidD [Schaalia hyovaginalis]MDY5506056.1 membrane protein insertion efficiency factor YidD [Schaalia hyovaginalis]
MNAPARIIEAIRRPIRWVLILPIRLYRRFISPMIAPRCRYAPSCSTYAMEAIEVHGPIKGIILGTWRLLRCNPWSLGGVDHVPPKGRWKPEPWTPPEDWAGNATDIVRPTPMGLEPLLGENAGAALVPENPPAKAGRSQGARRARTA